MRGLMGQYFQIMLEFNLFQHRGDERSRTCDKLLSISETRTLFEKVLKIVSPPNGADISLGLTHWQTIIYM